MGYSTSEWLQISIFILICGYPFLARNLETIDHDHDTEGRHAIIEFIHGSLVLGTVVVFLLALIFMEVYRCLSKEEEKIGLYHTIVCVSNLIRSKIVPEGNTSNDGFKKSNTGFINLMNKLTSPLIILVIFLWSFSYYPSIFYKDQWWFGIILFFPYIIIFSVGVYSFFTR